jgi:hypothetical protein
VGRRCCPHAARHTERHLVDASNGPAHGDADEPADRESASKVIDGIALTDL